MSCASCADRVERQLNKTDGVRASVNFATRVATIEVDHHISATDLCAVVRRAGYDASPRTPLPQPGVDPDMQHARNLLRRLVVAIVLFVPLADLSVMFAAIPDTRFL